MPDFLVRYTIRRRLAAHMAGLYAAHPTPAARVAAKMAYVADLKRRPIAVNTQDANKQHYEVPAEFYELALGPHKKYSCGLWPAGTPAGAAGLAASEEAALALVCERARISGEAPLRVLDMGCGWGSVALYIAARFPRAEVVAVSNSASQKAFIDKTAAARGLANLKVVTADINRFQPEGTFDRVVTVEMMEHAKNYEKLLGRVASWLKPGGLLFVHIFTHKDFAYHFDEGGWFCRLRLCHHLPPPPSPSAWSPPFSSLPRPRRAGWMAENFFSGGQMPSDDLLLHFQRDVALVDHWILPGTHYARTCNAWLELFDSNREAALAVLAAGYGEQNKRKQLTNWRLFFLACAELFDFEGGDSYAVSHYLFAK